MTSRVRQQAVKARYLYRYHRKLGTQVSPVVIFSMGKVGSTAIKRAIRDDLGRPVIHVHHITRLRIAASREYRASIDPEVEASRHHWIGDYARWRLRVPGSGPWEVITGVREPVGYAVSAFFQTGERLGTLREFDPDGPVDLDRLAAAFEADYFAKRALFGDWFASELRGTTGIDVLRHPAPVGGVARYDNERFRVLLLRFEDLAACGPDALGDFLGLGRPLPLPEANVGDTKAYASLYKQFRLGAPLSERFLDAAFDSATARHFYTADELDAFRSRWTRA